MMGGIIVFNRLNLSEALPMSAVHTEVLNMKTGDHQSRSYLAYPAGQTNNLPGVMVLPEFWGLTERTKSYAHKLATQGYTALAVDIYGNELTPGTAEEAKAEMQNTLNNLEKTTAHLYACLEALQDLQQVNENKIAVTGYCLGGGLALHLARLGANIKGAVSFHGGLTPKEGVDKNTQIKAKLLVLHGSKDTMIPMEQVDAFKKEMDERGADYKVICYPEALHGFTNSQATENAKKFNIPTAYDEQADKASWQEMSAFLKDVLA